jgi:S-adenosyl methyltransferase
MYDYMLGGYHNFAIDREYAERAEQVLPGVRKIAHANRAFLGRAVQWLADAGIRQFLDIGSGIPTSGNVHEVAERVAPETRVMYVDIDPVAVAHTRAILAGNPRIRVLQEDLRKPWHIVGHPDVTGSAGFFAARCRDAGVRAALHTGIGQSIRDPRISFGTRWFPAATSHYPTRP